MRIYMEASLREAQEHRTADLGGVEGAIYEWDGKRGARRAASD